MEKQGVIPSLSGFCCPIENCLIYGLLELMKPVRKNIYDARWMRTILITGFLLIFGSLPICSASDNKDNLLTITSQEKKFINHYFNATEFHRKGALDKALDEYKEAYKYGSSNKMILNCIGRVYWEKGELDEAVTVYRKVLDESHDRYTEVRARSSLGVVYMDQGKYEKALEELQRCLDLEPEYARQMSYKTVINKCRAEID